MPAHKPPRRSSSAPAGSPAELVAAILASTTRGQVRSWGEWLDGDGRDLRPALLAAARARGVDLPEDAAELGGKRLVRACLARGEAAREVRSPIHRDEAFTCAHCGRDVPPGGRRPRDHCPYCLWSCHLDVVPGDRAADCGGLLEPVAVVTRGDGADLRFRCQRCGVERVNRVLSDVVPPDDPRALYELAQQAARKVGLR